MSSTSEARSKSDVVGIQQVFDHTRHVDDVSLRHAHVEVRQDEHRHQTHPETPSTFLRRQNTVRQRYRLIGHYSPGDIEASRRENLSDRTHNGSVDTETRSATYVVVVRGRYVISGVITRCRVRCGSVVVTSSTDASQLAAARRLHAAAAAARIAARPAAAAERQRRLPAAALVRFTASSQCRGRDRPASTTPSAGRDQHYSELPTR